MSTILDRIRHEAEKEREQAAVGQQKYGTTGTVGKKPETATASPKQGRQASGVNRSEQEEMAFRMRDQEAKMLVSRLEMEDIAAQYRSKPDARLESEYGRASAALSEALNAYNAEVTRYQHYHSPEGMKERHAALKRLLEEAEQARERARQEVVGYGRGLGTQELQKEAQARLQQAEADIAQYQRQMSELGQAYYEFENDQKLSSLTQDTEMAGYYDNANRLQADLDKVAAVMGYYSPAGGGDPDEIASYETYLADRYGLDRQAIQAYIMGGSRTEYAEPRTDGGYNNIYELYVELEGRRQEAAKALGDAGYDYDRMRRYEQLQQDMAAYEAKAAEWEAYARENGVGASVASVLASPAQGIDYLRLLLQGGGDDPSDLEHYEPANTYGMDVTNFVSTVRSTVSEEIEQSTNWELFGQNVASFLYQTGMSIGDSALQIAVLGSAAPVLMSAGAASNQAKSIIERGGTKEQALWGGLAAGAAELVFEKFSVESLMSIKNLSGWRSVLESTVKQMGVEASEEAFTEIANILADAAIMGDQSEFRLAVEQYMSTGMTRERAEQQAFLDLVGQVAGAAIGGAFSGGIMGGVQSIGTAAVTQAENRDTGAKLRKADEAAVQALIETGLANRKGSESERLAERLANKMIRGETISDAEIGALQRANAAATKEKNAGIEAALQELAMETVSAQQALEQQESPSLTLEDLAVKTVKGKESAAQAKAGAAEEAAPVRPVPYAVLNYNRQQSDALNGLGYGQHGTAAFEAVLESSGMGIAQARKYFDTAYEAGLVNTPANKVTLTSDIQKAAFSAGLRDYGVKQTELKAKSSRWAEYTSVQNNETAGFRYDSLPSGMTQEEADTIDLLGKAFGTTIRMGKLIGSNAQITASGEVTLDYDYERSVGGEKRNAVFYALHEIGMHRLMQVAPVAGQAFIDATIRQKNTGLPGTAVTETQAKQSTYTKGGVNLTVGKAMEEVSADSIFRLYNNDTAAFREALERVVNGKDEQAREGVRAYKGVLDWLITKLKSLWNKLRGKGETQTAAEIRGAIDELTELRELFENALSVAAERVKAEQEKPTKKAENKKTAPQDGVQLSINEKYAKEMLAWDGKSKRVFTLGTTSDALQSIGVRDSEIRLKSGKARDIINNPEHDMDQNTLAKLPEVLENPIAILKSQQVTKDNEVHNDGNTSRLVIFGTVNDTKGVPVAVVLELIPLNNNGRVLELSIVASAYGKTTNLSGFVQSSEVLYLDEDKKRTNSWLQSVGVQFPSDAINYGSLGSVTYSGDKVNIQGIPFSRISGATYVAASKEAPPLADWQKKLLEKLSKTGKASALSEDNDTQNSLKSGDEGASYEENGKQHSIKSLNPAQIRTALADVMDHGDMGDDNMVLLGNMPQFIQNISGISGDLYIFRNHAYENMVSEEQAEADGRIAKTEKGRRNQHFHALGENTIEQAILALEYPLITAADRGTDGNPALSMILPVFDKQDHPIHAVVSFYAGEPINGVFKKRPHVAVTFYGHPYRYEDGSGRKTVTQFVQEAVEGKRVLDYDNKKMRADLPVIAQDTTLGNITASALTKNVAQFQKEVKNFRQRNKIDYSLKEGGTDAAKELAKLKAVNEALREQFRVTKFAAADKKSLDAFTKKLLKDYESGADRDQAREMFSDLYTYMKTAADGKTPDTEDVWAVIQQKAYDAAEHILENSLSIDDLLWQETKDVRDMIRTTGITISKEYDHDLTGYESIHEFRKAHWGRIRLVNDGMPVDVFYNELASQYPGYFDESEHTTQPDQLLHISEWLEQQKPVEVNVYSHDMRNAAAMLAADIIERVYALPSAKPTYADRMTQKVKDAKAEGREKAKDAYLAGAMAQGKIMAEYQRKVKDTLKAERAEKEKAVREVKAHYQAKERTMSQRRKEQVLRARIMRHAADMSKKLLRPTDKQHIPQELQGAVAELLAAINLESAYTRDPETGALSKGGEGLPSKRTAEFRKVREQYEDIAANNEYDMVLDPSLLGVPSEGIPSVLDAVIKMSDVRISDMNLEQLETVWDVLRMVEHSISTAGKLLSASKWERTSEAAEAFEADTASRRSKRSLTERHYMLDIETPYTFFSHFGEAGHAFYRMLRDAQDAEQVMQDQLAERVRGIVSKEARATAEKETMAFTTGDGISLTLSRAHMMEIYLLSKREQALGHLLRGGIIQPKVGKIRRGTEAVLLTEADLAQITSALTEDERTMADGLQKVTLLLAEWGNKASMQVYGYEKFKDPNYWTIKSAGEGIHQNVEKGQNKPRSIANMGSAKAVIPKASNPLDISGVFATLDHHASDMLCYSAWLAVMEDANRLFNFKFRDASMNLTGKTMKSLLNKYGGDGSTQYWLRLMEDIQNGLSAPADTATEGVVTKAIGKVKKASVAGNLRVVIQQPTAYLRALAVLDVSSMSAAVAKDAAALAPAVKGWKKAVEYAPIAARKASGGFEIGSNPKQLGEILYQSETRGGKIKDGWKEAPLWAAGKMDEITWGTVWNACEHQIGKDQGDLEKGSEQFYRAVAELFTEVIDQTQVVDGVLQRSQAMRSGSNFMKQMTAFTGEPTQGANMIIRAWDMVRYETDPKKRGKAIKVLGRTAAAYLITSVVNAFAQSLIDALRDDEDEDYWAKVWAAFSGINGNEKTWWDFARNILLASNMTNNLNPLTWLPVWKDVLAVAQGYSVERMDAATMGDFIDSIGNAAKSFGGNGKYTIGYATLKSLVCGSKLLGSSAFNILRDLEGVVRTFQVETDDLVAQYNTEKLMTNPKNNEKRYMDLLFEAYENDQAAYKYIHADLLNSGYMADELEDAIDSRKENAALTGTGYKTSKAAYDALYALQKDGKTEAYSELLNKLLDAEYKTVDGRVEHPFTEQSVENAMHSRRVNDGIREMGFATTDGAYDSMYDDLMEGDMGDYYKMVVNMMGLEVEPSDIESAMRSRAKEDGLSVEDLTEELAAGGFKPKFPVPSPDDFTIDDLTSSQYKSYSKSYGQMVDELMDGFARNGFWDLDAADANAWLGSAYSYARETALEIATDGEYESDIEWIIDAQAAAEQGVSVFDYIITKEGYGGSAAEKLSAAAAYDISAEEYQNFRDMLIKYDKPTENGILGTFTQEEAKNAIAAMPGLTREQRAFLWQSVSKSWSEKNNPWR